MTHFENASAWFFAILLAAVVESTADFALAQPPTTAPASAGFLSASDPAMAEKLKLTDEQRAKIAALRIERTEALSQAEPANRAKVHDDFEQKLAALLSEEQRAELLKASADAQTDIKLRFNFRFQRWSDVLEWFADQAQLSLVLDTPPPGTFNYSDGREYTVSEALDLLNGVLSTKGYTLIRREKMLLVVDVAEGVPETLVPRIELADLEKRGKFELVSMLFKTGERNVDDVVKEIAPLLGPRGKSLPLPKTKQLLVTDTAGVMRAIHAVIESMPQPDKPKEAVPPEKPELVVYPLKSADPDAAVKVLEALMPGARFVRDPKANQLSAYATPTEQAAVKRVLEQMQATTEGSPDRQGHFEVYSLDETDPQKSLATLQPLVPSARLTVDPTSKKLAAWGTATEHEILKKAIVQLAQGPGGQDDRQLEVYKLTKAEPSAILTLLQTIVPRARLSIDTPTRSIVALASLADQKAIRATLDQLDLKKPDPNAPEVRFYPFEQTPPATLTTALQTLAPKAQVTVDAAAKRLTVLASPADHETVRATLDQFGLKQPDPNLPEIRFYPFEQAPPTGLTTALQTLAPKAQVTVDTTVKRLTVLASPADHEVVKRTFNQFVQATPVEEKRQLVIYPVTTAQRKRFQVALQDLVAEFPTVKVLTDAEPGELAIWAKSTEHKVIADVIEKLKQQASPEETYTLVAYSIHKVDPTSVMTMLQNLFPTAKLVLDAKNRKIVAWTRPAEQATIKSLIEQMDTDVPDEARNQLLTYPIVGFDPISAVPTLKLLAPDATLSYDSKANTIVAWARKPDHAVIASALERLQPSKDSKSRPHVVSYPVGASDPATLYPLINALIPTARMVPNAKNGTIAVWATPDEHESIRVAIEEVTKSGPLDASAQVVVYPVKTAELTSTVSMLQTLFSTVRFTYDLKNRRILAFGRPAEQEAIKATIEQMDAKPTDETSRQLAVFPISGTDPTTTITMLKSLVPETTLTSDTTARTIVAWGPQSELEQIALAIERMQPNSDPKRRPRVVAYAVGAADPTLLAPLVVALVPTARAVANAKAGTIAVWATPEDHATIRAAIEEMTAKRSDDNAAKVVVYSLKSLRAANAIQALQPTVPEARLGMGAGLESRKLVAFARPADHAIIRNALEELDQEEDVQRNGPVLKTYPITTADPATLFNTLQAMFAGRTETRLSLDAKTNRIVAMATPAVHETIRGMIEELERGSAIDATTKLEVHPLRNADPDVVLQVLNNLVTKQSSRVLLSVDAKARQLMAIAPPEQQARIRETIERLQTAPRQLAVFQLEIVEPLTAAMAIEKLFSEAGGLGKAANAPTVDSDAATQRLYVRAGKEQLEQIRELLVKMGETNLATDGDGAGRSLRVIPFSGDTKAALAEIQRVWPQLSKHPLRILQPHEVPPRWNPKAYKEKGNDEPRRVLPENPAPAVPKSDDAERGLNKQTRLAPSASEAYEVKTAAQEGPTEKDSPADEEKDAAAQGATPIIVAPGDDKITVMSDDREAIDQIESLLRALAPPHGSGGRDIMVFPLHSASSTTVADLLQKLFRRGSFGLRDGTPVVVEADQRLNAIVVYAGRNDRAAIERLLKTLDSEDVPESLVANRPSLLPVKNTHAAQIVQMLKDVYKTQLTSGGVKQPIPVPSGASLEVAAVIQQINTAATGPLMTLGVDDATNSIVIMAPGPLVKEVSELVGELDAAALTDSSRGVRIVKLKSTSAQRVKEVLDVIIKDAIKRKGTTVRP